MKIVMTGGGSGGHITPLLAVAHELKRLQPGVEIIYIGQKGDTLSDIPAQDPNIDAVYAVWAGKLRRYADENWLKRLTDIRTQLLNIRDVSRVVRGVWQSYWLLRKLRPAVVFTRGGFVSVPVGVGARLNHIPYITHDSDSLPSLANRLIAGGAAVHAVALPIELYPYPQHKTKMVGVPASVHYKPLTPQQQEHYRTKLGLAATSKVLLLTGGGNGSRILNEALIVNTRYLLGTFPDLIIVDIAGRTLEAETVAAYDALHLGAARSRVQVHGFVSNLHEYSGVADVVIARAGATTLAEFALQAKACIIIPAPQLAGDHQSQNARALAERGAIMQLSEEQIAQPERLGRAVGALLSDAAMRVKLATQLATYARPDAAVDLALLVLETAGGGVDAPKEK